MNKLKLFKENTYLNKLSGYAALSSAFLALNNSASAQIVYKDVDPDLNVFVDDIAIDLDGNGTNDFKLVFLTDSFTSFSFNELKLRINPLGDNQVAYSLQTIPVTYSGEAAATYFFGATEILFTNVPVMNSGELVTDALNFHYDIGVLYENLIFYINSSSNAVPFAGGHWDGVEDRFAAIKLYADGEFHYGWLRLSVSTETGIVLKDYAYEINPDTPLSTVINAYSIHWNSVGDFGTSGTAADLNFDFNAAGDEGDIQAYKVICVKAGVTDFSYTDANALTPDRYVEIIPDGSANYNQSFGIGALDCDGDPILTGQSYVLYVLNVMQPAINYENILSSPSSVFLLIDNVETALDLSIADINNNGNGTDVRINFSKASIEQGIESYRVFLVQKDVVADFNLADALLLTSDRYTAVSPGTTEYEIILPPDALDADGNTVQPDKYRAFVVSVPDGISVNEGAITAESNIISLETATSTINEIVLSDIAELGNGSDISVAFPAPPLEQTVDEYRLIFVDFATAFDFNIDDALATGNYVAITPNGTDVVFTGNPDLKDSEGNLITWGVPYYAYVLSKASSYGISDTLSAPSNQLILNFPVAVHETIAGNPEVEVNNNLLEVNLPGNFNASSLSIIATNGQVVFESSHLEQSNRYHLNLPTGVYVVSIIYDDNTWSKSVVIGN